MLTIIAGAFGLSLLAPFLVKRLGISGWTLSLYPLISFLIFLTWGFREGIALEGKTLKTQFQWLPELGVNLQFAVDGLSWLFLLIITGIGTLVFIYAGGYLKGHPQIGRFFAYITAFMASMLGLVSVDNIIGVFIFWELTSLTSYLLIGFNHDNPKSRDSALRALVVTGLGGIALLVGLLILRQISGVSNLSELSASTTLIQNHILFLPCILLILIGAFTKSAQFPFHFWLPGAMEAPTPVSAYLHSATMVKAGIYLLARFSPVFSDNGTWVAIVSTVGLITMVMGAVVAIFQTDLKRVLAYSTVSSLGVLTFLLGLGTELSLQAAMLYLVVHSLYKGTLFLVTGNIDHETGTRDLSKLSGIKAYLPKTMIAAVVAALSMGGIIPFLGFVAKEFAYEATLQLESSMILMTTGLLVANMLTGTAAIMAGAQAFFGPVSKDLPKHPHEAPFSMLLGPLTLAFLGLIAGIFCGPLSHTVFPSVFSSVTGLSFTSRMEEVHLALWHGLTPALGLSVITLLGAVGFFYLKAPLQKSLQKPVSSLMAISPLSIYEKCFQGLFTFASFQTRVIQNGYLRKYLFTLASVFVLLIGYSFIRYGLFDHFFAIRNFYVYQLLVTVLVIIGAITAVFMESRTAAIAALSVVGLGITLTFVFFGAPDLSITQLMIETLTLILFVLVLYRLPYFKPDEKSSFKWKDATLAVLFGAMVTGLILEVQRSQLPSKVSEYHAEASYIEAFGKNVVNVILVDFRGIDTMGEIVVLAIAGLGVFGLLVATKERSGEKK
jgi:multicomponent Na+:H+ antiporter subunit A